MAKIIGSADLILHALRGRDAQGKLFFSRENASALSIEDGLEPQFRLVTRDTPEARKEQAAEFYKIAYFEYGKKCCLLAFHDFLIASATLERKFAPVACELLERKTGDIFFSALVNEEAQAAISLLMSEDRGKTWNWHSAMHAIQDFCVTTRGEIMVLSHGKADMVGAKLLLNAVLFPKSKEKSIVRQGIPAAEEALLTRFDTPGHPYPTIALYQNDAIEVYDAESHERICVRRAKKGDFLTTSPSGTGELISIQAEPRAGGRPVRRATSIRPADRSSTFVTVDSPGK